MGTKSPTRRRLLSGISVSVAVALAGCQGDDGNENESGNGGGGSSDGELGEKVREFTFLTYPQNEDPIQHEVAQMTASNMRELGIDLTIDSRSFNSLVSKVLVEHNYDMWTIGWSGSPERLEPDFWLSGVFHSSQMKPGSYNFMQWKNDEWDELAEEQRGIFDYEKRKEVVDETQEIWAEELPVIPTVSQSIAEPYNADVVNNLGKMTGQGIKSFWNYLNMKIDRDDNTFKHGDTDALESTNPLRTATTQNRQFLRLVYDRLFRITQDLEAEPWAAESYERVNETTFEVTLRDGMTFHDGEDVTAEDVKFSYDYQSEFGALTPAFLQPLESTEVIDDLTVRFNLSEPFAPFVWNGFGFVFIIPKHIWEDVPDNVDAENPSDFPNEEAIGSGPFVLEDFQQDERLVITKNEDHFNPANIDRSILVFGPQQSINTQVEEGELDAATTSAAWVLNAINRLEKQDSIEIFEVPTHGYNDLTPNTKRPPFDDPAFRRAIAYMAPRQDMLDTLLGGRGYVVDSTITQANERWHNSDIPKYELDLEAARAELEEAGYGWDDDGKLHYPPDKELTTPTEAE